MLPNALSDNPLKTPSMQEAILDLDGPIVRLATSDQPIPYSPHLMEAVVPTVERIRGQVERLLAF